MNLKRIFFFLAFWLFFQFPSTAQVPFYEQIDFNHQNRPVKVSRILRDKAGWLFFGTDSGLFRYDGIRFEKILVDDIEIESPISALYEARDGKIWIGYRNGMIAVCNRKKIKTLKVEEGFPKVAITAFSETPDSAIWIGTNGEGIYCFMENRLYNIDADDGLKDNFIHDLLWNPASNTILAGNDQGLEDCSFRKKKKLVKDFIPQGLLPDHIVTAIAFHQGRLIVGTQDKGICFYDTSTGKVQIAPMSLQQQTGPVNKILAVGDELWIGTEGNGIFSANAGSGQFNFQSRNTTHFPQSKIKDMCCDLEGNVWIACAEGLFRSSGKKIRYLEKIGNEKISFVHSLLFDSKGNCWFSPDQGLIKMWQDQNGHLQYKKIVITPPAKLIDIVTLYEDPYGFIWIGTMGDGIYLLNSETFAFRKITENPSLLNGSILTISGQGDDVWIGGFDGTAHCTITGVFPDREEISFTENVATQSLLNAYIYSIYPEKNNRTWFGTDGDGAYRLDGNKMTNLSSSGFKPQIVYSLVADPYGNFWFNTQDHGIYRFDGKSFRNYSIPEGLTDMTVYSMQSDKRGNLLLAHKNGIDKLIVKENRFTYINGFSQLDNLNPDLNSIAVNPKGEIIVGTEKFLLWIYSDEKQVHSFPQTFLENIAVFQKEPEDTSGSFSSEQNNFTFGFTGRWYSNPSLVQYQYTLEGFNDQWITTTDREINFPRLAPGSYTFKVRSSLNNDFTGASEASYAFIIHPPFYKTFWFQLVITLVISLLLYGFIRWRDRRIRKIERLKKEAAEFQFEMLKSQVNPHFLFNSFNTLISIIEEDQKTAVGYVEKLSEFFRSIISYRDKSLIPLKEELNLLQNYFYLQKKRYGQYLHLKVNVSEQLREETEIPPLTLQLLTENAIKHNAISRESTLEIEIRAENRKLIIQNNINSKMVNEKSPGMGLQNIINRYKILTSESVEVINEEKTFTVKIPLIQSNEN